MGLDGAGALPQPRPPLVTRDTGGGTAEAFALDVTRADDADRVMKQVTGMWGRIDILVNNAGVITYDNAVWATTIDQWDEAMNTNLRGLFLVSRAVIPHMMQRKEGVIINIGSSSGRLPEGDYGAYATSKWGVVGSLAHCLRPHASGSTASIPTGWIPIWPGRMIPKGTSIG